MSIVTEQGRNKYAQRRVTVLSGSTNSNNWLPLKRHPVADPLGHHYRITFFFFTF